MNKKSIGIVIPAFNKETEVFDSISRLIKVVSKQDWNARVVVVNDGSTDGTRAVLLELSQHGEFEIIDLEVNTGKGNALRVGFNSLLGWADVFAYIDADMDLHPEGLIYLVDEVVKEKSDIAIGSKRHPASRVIYPLKRKVMSEVFRIISRTLLGIKVSDSQTGLKVFSSTVIETCLNKVEADGFAFDLELLAIAARYGYSIKEGPVQLDFQFGSTVGLRNSTSALKEVLFICYRTRVRKSTLPE